jgi:hypothetical protein
LNLLEESIGENLQDTGIGNAFLDKTPTAQEKRIRIDK